MGQEKCQLINYYHNSSKFGHSKFENKQLLWKIVTLDQSLKMLSNGTKSLVSSHIGL